MVEMKTGLRLHITDLMAMVIVSCHISDVNLSEFTSTVARNQQLVTSIRIRRHHMISDDYE